MHVAILITTPDFAGLNVKQRLLELAQWREAEEQFEQWPVLEWKQNLSVRMYTTATKCTHCEQFDKKIGADLFIIPTTHRSAAGVRSFTVHSVGNWGNADLGGKPRTLGVSPAALQREALFKIRELAQGLPYEVVLEATHHGPDLQKPCLFMEIGSGPEQWQDPAAGSVIAKALLDLLSSATGKIQLPYRSAFGIGGPHYVPNFLKVMERSDIAFGHIIPKHQLQFLDAEMLQQVIAKTLPKPELAVLDWKGLGEHKQRVVQLLRDAGLTWEKTADFTQGRNSASD